MEDNGPGFSAGEPTRPGRGLRSIRDRVALLGGTIEQGTLVPTDAYVRLRIPFAFGTDPSA